ncbi:nuclease A inhibitor family protein [Tychonema sp. LEGE 07203]|uniref:nuclease A inhibitor family protein n=1 Tax=Tychonema sp. LEGE 07203 TaxID=1828671 RepID=UPI0018814C9C|nr:nuclease A inhibitor family protein [Tychonema sp. LEGE 07203]MBE9093682.1 nuclease A inhibitor family protein [Tychonema sp. LEGE 07203]
MTDSIADQLQQASKGLLFLSESDAPFEVIQWPAQGELTPPKLLQLTGHPPDAPVELRTVDDFFAIATVEEDWHDQDERETVQRFHNLVSILKQNLSQLQVYRVGSIDIDVYIVGVTDGGELVGLSTKLVET